MLTQQQRRQRPAKRTRIQLKNIVLSYALHMVKSAFCVRTSTSSRNFGVVVGTYIYPSAYIAVGSARYAVRKNEWKNAE